MIDHVVCALPSLLALTESSEPLDRDAATVGPGARARAPIHAVAFTISAQKNLKQALNHVTFYG
jgi:hypothetical protein